jgi:hypothetical protein
MIKTDITRLEEPEDISALIIGDIVDSKLIDYKGILICAGEVPEKEYLRIMVTKVTNIAYFLGSGDISVENGKIIQKTESPKYERGRAVKLFEEIDRRLFG